MNDVAPLVQMKLPSANDVMLRINDVALCANGVRAFTLCAEIESSAYVHFFVDIFAGLCYNVLNVFNHEGKYYETLRPKILQEF